MTETFGVSARRSLFPLVWLAGALVVAGLSALRPPAIGAMVSPEVADTYYVAVHGRVVVSLAMAFVFMAGVYAVLDFSSARYRPALGWMHFGLTLLGACLVFSQMLFFNIAVPPTRFLNPETLLAILNGTAAVGYGMMLLSLGVFALLLGEMISRKAAGR